MMGGLYTRGGLISFYMAPENVCTRIAGGCMNILRPLTSALNAPQLPGFSPTGRNLILQ